MNNNYPKSNQKQFLTGSKYNFLLIIFKLFWYLEILDTAPEKSDNEEDSSDCVDPNIRITPNDWIH